MSSTPENVVKKDVKKFLNSRGFVPAGLHESKWPEVVTGWYYMPVQNGMGVVGIPDFICCWEGRFLAIETKAPGKRGGTSPNQKLRLAEIQASQGIAVVIDDVEQLKEIFRDHQKA